MKSEQSEEWRAKILVVDDTIDDLKLMVLLLRQQGYEVESATSGKIALQTAISQIPDLILLDVRMSGVTGYQVCKALKKNHKTREIPVIFLSASDQIFSKVQAFQVGGVDYITKPYEIEEVLLRIEQQITIQRQKVLLEEKIEEQKKIETQLQQSHAFLTSVLNSSLDGIVALEAVRDNSSSQIRDFRVLVVNPVAAKIFDCHGESLTDRLVSKRFLDRFDTQLFELFVRVIETERSSEKDCNYDRDGIHSWYQLSAVKLDDGVVVTFRDISERKKMELVLKQTNQELYRLANLDSLTQVANRRRFDEYLTQQWHRCARERQSISLILCDVDFFKNYNDRYGHQAGDVCLTQIAQAIERALKRPADLLARYGGEEFAAILPNTDIYGAEWVAKLILVEVERLHLVHDASQVSDYVTLSVGVSSQIPTPESSFEDLMAIVDRALYTAKQEGRNRIVKDVQFSLQYYSKTENSEFKTQNSEFRK